MKIPNIPYHQGKNKYEDRDGKKYGIAIHNTSNSAPATNESIYADHRTDGTSSHFYVDDKQVIQSLDTSSKAGHAGSYEGNEHAIAFEITGTNTKSRDWWLSNVAWDKLAYVVAYMIKNDPDYKAFEIRRATVSEMKTNPRVKAFYSHNDMRLAWGGTDHTDPGPNFPWDKLISSVKEALNGKVVSGDTNSGGVNDLFCKLGDKGQAVKALQVRLKNLGYDIGKAGVDGVYGDDTKTALKAACLKVNSSTAAQGDVYDHNTMFYVDVLMAQKYGGGGTSFPATFIFNGTVKPA